MFRRNLLSCMECFHEVIACTVFVHKKRKKKVFFYHLTKLAFEKLQPKQAGASSTLNICLSAQFYHASDDFLLHYTLEALAKSRHVKCTKYRQLAILPTVKIRSLKKNSKNTCTIDLVLRRSCYRKP